MSFQGISKLDRKIQEFRAQYGRNPNVPMPERPRGRIHKVTDLRTGLEHPTRDHKGRFISRKRATRSVQIESELASSPSILPVATVNGMICTRFPQGWAPVIFPGYPH